MRRIIAVFLFFMLFSISSAVDFSSMPLNTWQKINTSGTRPGYGVETHLAFDTSGNMYMLGACAYYQDAGGTHNNDIFRFNISTGVTALPWTCGNNPWPGGCQGGQVFDPSRNCIWFGPGYNAVCRNGVEFFPGQNYYGGLYKMQCPDGRPEMVRTSGISGTQYLFDAENDLVIGVAHNNYYGAKLHIYDIQNDAVYTVASPWNPPSYHFRIPCCFDTKRGRVVITRWGNNGSYISDLWYYNTTTKQWSKQTPNGSVPPHTNVPLMYEPVADKYVLIGSTGTPYAWVYDPVTNRWTQVSTGSGPPLRVYPGSFGYSVKDGVIANWGGLPTGGGGDAGSVQPIWTFKLSEKPTTAIDQQNWEKEMLSGRPFISAAPNPFHSRVIIKVSGLKDAAVRIFNMSGKLVADLGTSSSSKMVWNGMNMVPAVYVVTAKTNEQVYSKKLLLAR
jgi:hypothetical protein